MNNMENWNKEGQFVCVHLGSENACENAELKNWKKRFKNFLNPKRN